VKGTSYEAPPYVVFSSPPITFTLFRPNSPLSTLFSNTLNLAANMRDLVTNDEEVMGEKLIVCYNAKFLFADMVGWLPDLRIDNSHSRSLFITFSLTT
jgi:hypothetical protein